MMENTSKSRTRFLFSSSVLSCLRLQPRCPFNSSADKPQTSRTAACAVSSLRPGVRLPNFVIALVDLH